MADLLTLLSDRLAPAFALVAAAADGDLGDVDPVVRPSDRADAQANGALPLAKQLGRNPRDVVADVLAAVDLTGVATAEIAGPGFINLTVDDAFLSSTLAGIAADERLGIAAQPAKRVVVDYSAPNVAKQMHIGTSAPPPSVTRSSECSTSSATTLPVRTTSATGAGRSGSTSKI